jgi:hypothetical protein
MTFGWTWEYVDEYMTLPRLSEIAEYWEHQPPVHLLVARYLGVKPKTADKPLTTDDNAADFFKQLGITPQDLVRMENERPGSQK